MAYPPPPDAQPWPSERSWGRTALAVGLLSAPAIAAAAAVSVALTATPPAPKVSDEDQIRSVVGSFVDTHNRYDLRGFKLTYCAAFQQRAEKIWNTTRLLEGPMEIQIESISVTGETATVNATLMLDDSGVDSLDFPFVRENGHWKICP